MNLGAEVLFQCQHGYYGALGDVCTACPVGGACDGGFAMPVAQQGYFPSTDGSEVAFVACTPPDACLGGANATCSELYTGPRCADCGVGAYR